MELSHYAQFPTQSPRGDINLYKKATLAAGCSCRLYCFARLLVLLAVIVVLQRYFSPSLVESSASLFGIGVYCAHMISCNNPNYEFHANENRDHADHFVLARHV